MQASYPSLASHPDPNIASPLASLPDLQLRPYRTDDFITKLFYETSRFSAFNLQWVVKAHILTGHKSPNLSVDRSLEYQVRCKKTVKSFIFSGINIGLDMLLPFSFAMFDFLRI